MLKYHAVALISHASKVMLKILQARLQQYVPKFPRHAGFPRGRSAKDCRTPHELRQSQSPVAVCGLLIAAASLVVEHRL